VIALLAAHRTNVGGNGIVDEYAVHANGSLGQIGSITAGAAGGADIVAS
jgi:hypothetical protein